MSELTGDQGLTRGCKDSQLHYTTSIGEYVFCQPLEASRCFCQPYWNLLAVFVGHLGTFSLFVSHSCCFVVCCFSHF